jgi:hypothetical protein
MRLQRRCEAIAESYTKKPTIFAALDAPPRLAEGRALEIGIDKIGANGSMRGFLRRTFAALLQQGMVHDDRAIARGANA